MATTPTETNNTVGTFVSDVPIGYVEPSREVVAGMRSVIHQVTFHTVPRQLLKDLLTIKLLAPEESKELIVYNIPQAIGFISEISELLVRRYHSKE